jgi:hypothetical protein
LSHFKPKSITESLAETNPTIIGLNQATPASVKNVTDYLGDGSHYEGDYKPNVTISSAWAQDRHASIGSSNLYVECNLNNSGDGTVYELTLHVLTMNQYGEAIETTLKAGGITPHMSVGVSRELSYN